MPAAVVLLCIVLSGIAACGSSRKGDQFRTVTSYEFASCDSVPTSDATELQAIAEFQGFLGAHYLLRADDAIYLASHESTTEASGIRQYEGPFYFYVHPVAILPEERAAGVDWKAMLYLHVSRVRSRANGAAWGEWAKVRTRNFGAGNTRTTDGLGRWKCLLGAEMAWAEVVRRNSQWSVDVQGAGPYDARELELLEPLPTRAQVEGSETVAAAATGGNPRPD
jgi:hypothetical protein